ncbi:MAG TPA: ribosome maturation factor RimM [Negativicutes bacterium]|nr:ribosome maturation factor RimM [Negativicutes bacterium]
MKENMIAVARITTPHGVRGEVKLQPLTDFPHRFEETEFLLLADGTRLVLESARLQMDTVLAKFRGMDTPEIWIPFRHKELYVTEDALMPLPEGQYYIHQLVGIEVVDENGAALGKVSDVLQTGSNDVYVVQTPESNELLLPAIDTVVKRIDMAKRLMVVTLPEYL